MATHEESPERAPEHRGTHAEHALFEGAARLSPRRSAEHFVLLGLGVAGVLTILFLGLFLDADPRGYGTHEQLGMQPCFPMQAWNVPCPGCGVTTAVTLAAKGHPLASLVTQPFGFLLALLWPLATAWMLLQHLRGRDVWLLIHGRLWARLAGWSLAAMLVAWAYKVGRVRAWW